MERNLKSEGLSPIHPTVVGAKLQDWTTYFSSIVTSIGLFVAKVSACIIITCSTANAETYKVKVRYDPDWISRVYLQSVLDNVKFVYRRDLRARLLFRVVADSRVDHALYAHDVALRYQELYAWRPLLRRAIRRIQLVAVGAYFDADGRSYGAGLFSKIALVVIRQVEAFTGGDRFACDFVSVAHEIAHALGARHTDATKLSSIMHPDACRYATQGIEMVFVKKTKNEISRYQKSRQR